MARRREKGEREEGEGRREEGGGRREEGGGRREEGGAAPLRGRLERERRCSVRVAVPHRRKVREKATRS